MTAIVCLAMLLFAGQDPNRDKPLPNPASMWDGVKPSLMSRYFEFEILKGYTYRRSSLVEELRGANFVKKARRIESEVYYFDNGPFSKVISVDEVPLSEIQLKKQEEAFERFRQKGAKGSWRPWAQKKSPKEIDERLTDVYNAFDFTVVRREMRFDRPTIVVDFKPKKNPKLKTMVGRLMLTKVAGTAWIDEADLELAKIELKYIKDVKIGFGILATLGDESELKRDWRKINDEVWLPLRTEARAKGRAWFFVDGFNAKIIEEFSDYKKFSVNTTIKVIDD